MAPEPLSPEHLFTPCDPKSLGFRTTDELGADVPSGSEGEVDAEIFGQGRALEAVHFGSRIDRQGFNLYLMGEEGVGKQTTLMRILSRKSAKEAPARDWVYVHNFEIAHKPNAIELPCGRGIALSDAMQRLVEDLRTAVPAAFESEGYQKRREAIDAEMQEAQKNAFDELQAHAEEKGLALIRTPMGFGIAPVKDGSVIRSEVFQKLEKSEQERLQREIATLQEELEGVLKRMPKLDKGRRDAIRALGEETTAFVVRQPIEELIDAFSDLAQVVSHLKTVQKDMVENIHTLLALESSSLAQAQFAAGEGPQNHFSGFNRYQVNVLVSGTESEGAPVVYDDHPTLGNILGRVEHVSRMGTLVTDFSLIKAGSLHRANGGYLVLEARKLLTQPFVWEALKRCLRAGEITIETPGQMLGFLSTTSLEPEPIPLKVKVALFGERTLYYLLERFDPEFSELFKVVADFDDVIDRRERQADWTYARMLARIVGKERLTPFSAEAIAAVIERSGRIAEDARKVSAKLENVADLMCEADHYALQEGQDTVGKSHVQNAIDARRRRSGRIEERIREAVEREIIRIDTDGEAVGQVNGLSVVQLGDMSFGKPSRISARVRVGAGEVVDIEREVELGGALHSKGVLILSAFLGAHFAADYPLSLSASLVFEQSYGGVDGDSASSAELYALLSALAGVPIGQSFAVTGSVDQFGQVQAIGGVNDKIEGFFDVCRDRGLTGKQGVLIPQSNVQHLMLRHDVVDAVRDARFRIFPIASVSNGLALLCDIPVGDRVAGNRYAADTIFGRVDKRLRKFAEERKLYRKSLPKRGNRKP